MTYVQHERPVLRAQTVIQPLPIACLPPIGVHGKVILPRSLVCQMKCPPNHSMKFCLNSTIPDAVHLELKQQSSALHSHIEGEIQIVEFITLSRSQPRE
jgi:hypothetical protein